MPVSKCSNGKWKIGRGQCIYETKEKAVKAYQAILASGELAVNKVSFDYDGVLSTQRGKMLADSKKETLYIISARNDKKGMLSTAKMLNIPESRVYATGSNKLKVQKIKELGIDKHYDNNPDVISELPNIGILFK